MGEELRASGCVGHRRVDYRGEQQGQCNDHGSVAGLPFAVVNGLASVGPSMGLRIAMVVDNVN